MRRAVIFAFAGGISAHLLTTGIGRFAYTPMLTVMKNQGVLDVDTGGWLGAFIYVGYLLGALVLSVLRNRDARLLTFRLGLLAAVLSTFAMALTQNTTLWAISRIASGFSGTAAMLLAAEYLMVWLSKNNLRPDLGAHYVGLGLGICLSGVLALIMGTDLAWETQWLIYGAFAALLLPFAWILIPKPDKGSNRTRPKNTKSYTYVPATPKWFWLFGLGYMTAGWGYAVGATFSVDILTDLIGSNDAAVIVWIILGLATAAGALLGSFAARYLGIQRVLILFMLGQTASLAGYAVFSGTVLPLLSALVFGACFIAVVSLALLLSGLKTPDNPGAGMARMTLAYGMGQILGPAVTGWLVAAHGNYQIALWLVVALMSAGTCLTLWANLIEER